MVMRPSAVKHFYLYWSHSGVPVLAEVPKGTSWKELSVFRPLFWVEMLSNTITGLHLH